MIALYLLSAVCLFTPPKAWQAAKPKELSEYVQIGFVAQGSDGFVSSVNLATEAVDCGLKDYVKAVKEIHTAEPNTEWRDLGALKTKSETGRLVQITTKSAWGDLVMLQGIVVKKNVAYILTASMLKKDFSGLQAQVLESLKSMHVVSDLKSEIEDVSLQQKWSSLLKTLGENQSSEQNAKDWSALQQFVEKETEHLGAYWQFLALQEGHAKIYRK
jgi:hypothetical protein